MCSSSEVIVLGMSCGTGCNLGLRWVLPLHFTVLHCHVQCLLTSVHSLQHSDNIQGLAKILELPSSASYQRVWLRAGPECWRCRSGRWWPWRWLPLRLRTTSCFSASTPDPALDSSRHRR